MLIIKDMGTGATKAWIGPETEEVVDDYDDALSSGWDPFVAGVIHRERQRYEISQAEDVLPPDLVQVDIDSFLDRMEGGAD
jgi:hypothetical protein